MLECRLKNWEMACRFLSMVHDHQLVLRIHFSTVNSQPDFSLKPFDSEEQDFQCVAAFAVLFKHSFRHRGFIIVTLVDRQSGSAIGSCKQLADCYLKACIKNLTPHNRENAFSDKHIGLWINTPLGEPNPYLELTLNHASCKAADESHVHLNSPLVFM